MKLKVAPCPGSDSTQIRPPWRSTILLQIARPMPVPGYCLSGVQALEDQEDAILVLRVDADAVVAHGEQPMVSLPAGVHVDLRRRFAAELQRVADEVLEQLGQLRRVGPDGRQFAVRDFGSCLLDARVEVVQGLPQRRTRVGRRSVLGRGCPPVSKPAGP